MIYKNISIYYMSGTGNTYRAALQMAKVAGNHGIPFHIFPIEKGTPKKNTMLKEIQV